MTVAEKHQCDKQCVCPIHKISLWYSRTADDHVCPDPKCKYAKGMKIKMDTKHTCDE